LIIKVGATPNQDRMIYISVKVYKDELSQHLTDKKLSRLVAGTIGGLLLVGGIIFGYTFLKSKSSA
jgi:hypothetical protein